MYSKLTSDLKLSKGAYSFFLRPNCKALEHAHFLLAGVEGSSCTVEVDITGDQ